MYKFKEFVLKHKTVLILALIIVLIPMTFRYCVPIRAHALGGTVSIGLNLSSYNHVPELLDKFDIDAQYLTSSDFSLYPTYGYVYDYVNSTEDVVGFRLSTLVLDEIYGLLYCQIIQNGTIVQTISNSPDSLNNNVEIDYSSGLELNFGIITGDDYFTQSITIYVNFDVDDGGGDSDDVASYPSAPSYPNTTLPSNSSPANYYVDISASFAGSNTNKVGAIQIIGNTSYLQGVNYGAFDYDVQLSPGVLTPAWDSTLQRYYYIWRIFCDDSTSYPRIYYKPINSTSTPQSVSVRDYINTYGYLELQNNYLYVIQSNTYSNTTRTYIDLKVVLPTIDAPDIEDSSYADGWNDGYDYGYEVGYNKGISDADKQFNIVTLFFEPLLALGCFTIAVIDGVEITIGGIMYTMIGTFLLIAFLKFFAGG